MMDRKDAEELAEYAALTRKGVEPYQLANGDWCVRVANPVYFLWEKSDWQQFCQMLEDKQRALLPAAV